MHLTSLNVGLPEEVTFNGKTVLTGIFKTQVNRKLNLSFNNLEGDGQADLTVHGGRDKAVYAYAEEHYSYWQKELPEKELPWGIFGENLRISNGLFEEKIKIGDVFSIGSAELMAVQPRFPCFKLGIRFNDSLIVKKFMDSGKSGVYFRVIKEGEIEPGDEMKLIKNSESNITIAEIFSLMGKSNKDKVLLEKAVKAENLAENLKNRFYEVLEKI